MSINLDSHHLNKEPFCIIPARGRSPDLTKKNLKRLDGKPLVAHSIETALECMKSERVFVSTESKYVADIAREVGAQVPSLRPPELAESGITLRPVVRHTLEEISANVQDFSLDKQTPVVILQPNVPFSRSADLEAAVEKFVTERPDSVISVTKTRDFYWQRDNEYELSPLFSIQNRIANESTPVYRESGSITVTSPHKIREMSWPGASTSFIETDWLSSFKVDTLTDFWLAEKISQGPNIVFRTDGGDEIGLGKIYRALTIADELERIFECNITFVSGNDYQEGISVIESHGYEVRTVDSTEDDIKCIRELQPDIVLLDILNVHDDYHNQLHQLSAAVVDFENVYEGDEPVDIVINPQRTLRDCTQENYLNGPEFLVIRDEFRKVSSEINKKAENVLFTFGGTDPLGLTVDAIQVLGQADLGYNYRVILGPGFGKKDDLASLPDYVLTDFEFYKNVNNMSEHMEWADIAVTGGGRTVYELAATGTPSIVFAQNDGEVKRMELLRKEGAIEFLGHGEEVDFKRLPKHVRDLAEDFERRMVMRSRGQELVDGQGLDRIVNTIRRMFIGS